MTKISLILSFFILLSCSNKKNIESGDRKVKTHEKHNDSMENENEYAINYEFSVPSCIMINDVMVDIDLRDGAYGPEFINQYLLESGTHCVKIKVIHPYAERGKKFNSEGLKKLDKDLEVHNVDSKNNYRVTLVKKLKFPEIQQEVSHFEYEWTFEAQLPFKLEGWKNSEDLTQWDEAELEKQVLKKFNQLRTLLNNGNGIEFVKELKKCNEEYFKANYFTKDKIEEYTSNLIETYSEHKGIMPPIENCQLKIMGNGKVVTLENLGKYKGQSVLTTENKEKNILYLHYIMLHKVKNSDEFEIIRINSTMESTDED